MSERTSESRAAPSPAPVPATIELVDAQAIASTPSWAIIGIFFILLFGGLYLTASFVLPVIIALLFALVMSPVVRFLRRRLKIWEPISAFVLVIGTTMTLISGFYMLSDPIAKIVNDAPRYAAAVDAEMRTVKNRLERLRSAQENVEKTAKSAAGGAEDNEVVVKNPGLVDNATTAVPQMLASVGFTLVFLFFLLASGDLFYQKLIRSMPTLADKKRALHIAHDIERELSRYLFTITMINASLGIAVGTLLWWVDMPTPVVFGALAMLLNFIPYIGALIGMAIVGVIALADFGNLAQALVPVLLYLACTTIEGQLVTPTIVGRRLEMNAAAVFLSVAFWGWIWGVVGMFLAVPVMVAIKVFASYVEPLAPLGDFLSAETKRTPDEDD
ncbi:AI-2E family transporter [Aurantimonas sp. C2-6-R+9]|uniref:AI-2E family transporter n=1 Tax=unclassified Aurantimonas TaxID=2638230 RepID=UPI002E193D4E|nr:MULTISPECIES: AI-2E family transporter [unclassified Aurantimonas]MEC5291287.1 AI-2E family transporter [Aurantimonas sp. C2-3-R2]MEC5324410.1 AI-2E family transporter [Aurantimonas sp. A3-2-R12]MEC5381586.1 AI-2E family transporter [Aurantimonas sp. C2-6-R+9]MEC5412342.1 AI-2E family transporter [Aurantimonas sp. C2-4-R8]